MRLRAVWRRRAVGRRLTLKALRQACASLRVRLLLTLIGVALVAVGTVALLASRVTSNELQRYVELDLERNQRVFNTVMRAYDGDVGSAQPPQEVADTLAAEAGERVILTDSHGVVLGDSQHELLGQVLGCDDSLPAVIISVGQPACLRPASTDTLAFTGAVAPGASHGDVLFFGATADTLVLTPTLAFPAIQSLPLAQVPLNTVMIRRTQGQAADPIEVGFLSTVNRSLFWAMVVAGSVALALGLALARGILRPIEALTTAARRLEQGDLSERVAVSSRDEIGRLAHSFNAMADGLARQEALRRNMVTDIAHELRTPLTNIRGYLEALRDGVASPSPPLLGSLYEESLLLGRLIDDLQDLALAEAGQLRLATCQVAPADLLGQAVQAQQPAAAAKGLLLTLAPVPALPPIEADPARIGQVLRNLLTNAITHTPPGGTICVEAALHWPGSAEQHGELAGFLQPVVLVAVSDSGPGIAPEHLPNIFERFYRADRARARSTGGAGLGLAIVKQLVAAHGGRVWASSEPGCGARFSVALPLAAPHIRFTSFSSSYATIQVLQAYIDIDK